MDRDEFWGVITQVNGNEDALQQALERLDPAELLDFQKHFEQLFIESYHLDLWGAAYTINHGCSDDGFDYFREGLILLGKQVFEAALKNPESLEDVRSLTYSDIHSEAAISMAVNIYREKTGSEMPDTGVKRPSKPPGIPWDEGDLRQRYPRLWPRFRTST